MGKVTDEPLSQIKVNIQAIDPALGNSTELVRGYYQVISAGVSEPVAALDLLKTAAKTGKAAHVEQGEVVKGITKIMAAYANENVTAAQSADMLFAMERAGQTSVAELIPYIGELSAKSAALNISQTELGASFGAITKLAGSTSEAATQYKAIMTSLMKPTEDLTGLMSKYGGAQQAIKELGFEGVMRLISEAAGGNTEKLAALMGSSEALSGVLAITTDDFNLFNDSMTVMEDRAGSLDSAWQSHLQTYEAVKEKFDNTIDNLLVRLGETLLPVATDALNAFSAWFDENDDAIVESFSTIGRAAVTTIGALTEFFGTFVTTQEEELASLNKIREETIATINSLEDNIAKGGFFSFLRDDATSLEIYRAKLERVEDQIHSMKYVTGGTMEDITQSVGGATHEIVDDLASIAQEIEAVFNTGETGSKKVGAAASGAGVKITKSMREAQQEVDALTQSIEAAAKAEEQLGKNAYDIDYGPITKLAEQTVLLEQNMNNANVATARAIDLQNRLEDAVPDSYDDLGQATDGLSDNLDEAAKSADGFFAGFSKGFAEIKKEAMTLGKMGEALAKDLDNAVKDTVFAAARHYAYGLKNAKDDIKDTYNETVEAAERAYRDSLSALEDSYRQGEVSTERFEQERTALAERYADARFEAQEQYNRDIEEAEDQLGDAFDNIWTGVLDGILSKGSEWVVDMIWELGTNLVNGVSGEWEGLGGLFNGQGSGSSGGGTGIVDWIASLFGGGQEGSGGTGTNWSSLISAASVIYAGYAAHNQVDQSMDQPQGVTTIPVPGSDGESTAGGIQAQGAPGSHSEGLGTDLGSGVSVGLATGNVGYGIAAAVVSGIYRGWRRRQEIDDDYGRFPTYLEALQDYESGEEHALGPGGDEGARGFTNIQNWSAEALQYVRELAIDQRTRLSVPEQNRLSGSRGDSSDTLADWLRYQDLGSFAFAGESAESIERRSASMRLDDRMYRQFEAFDSLGHGFDNTGRDAFENGLSDLANTFSEIAQSMDYNVGEKLQTASYIGDSRGWESGASIKFTADLSEFLINTEDVQGAMDAIGFYGNAAGWDSEATLTMIGDISGFLGYQWRHGKSDGNPWLCRRSGRLGVHGNHQHDCRIGQWRCPLGSYSRHLDPLRCRRRRHL